ncbi:hypothetical protein BGX27_005892 [Mortierella sp. AM989]|nr:hypothetical protein BGX27_005892 [Mortierella sp. AM989]
MASAPAPTPITPPQPPQPAMNSIVPSHFSEPAPPAMPMPIVATLQQPSNDALTFTSYAGLLTTFAPAFYPLTSSAVAMSPSPLVPTAKAEPPTPLQSVVPIPIPTPLPIPIHSQRLKSWSTQSNEMTPVESKATPTRTKDQIETTTDTANASLISSFRGPSTTSDQMSEASTLSSVDITVSSTTTTRGYTTHTTTSVGLDGTTTVMTEYPLLTRAHDSQRTSGARRVLSHNQVPSESIFKNILGHFIFETAITTVILVAVGATMFLV